MALIAYTDSESETETQDNEPKITSNNNDNDGINPVSKGESTTNQNDTEIHKRKRDNNESNDEPPKKKRKIGLSKLVKKSKILEQKIEFIGNDNNDKLDKNVQSIIQKNIKHNVETETKNDIDNDNGLSKDEMRKNKKETQKFLKKQFDIMNKDKIAKLYEKKETTRQKNKRKQSRGQANFTLKWDRDCGFEMAGV